MFFESKASIYKQISAKAGKNGWLPADFLLSGESSVPGELEGKLFFRGDAEEMRPEVFEKFMRLLRWACEDPKKRKGGELAEYFEEHCVFQIIDRACEELFSEQRGIDIFKVLDVAFEWATKSENAGLVKLGIALMGMLNLDDREDCRRAIVTLGKYEEFTLYSLFAVSGWENGKEITSGYAHNLKGWGKIHAEQWL
ncbi:MAG: hypothetical protein FWG53_01630 [Clostridiales bacterium]|nr:hypothetical protein [Clostridiales bacterium]